MMSLWAERRVWVHISRSGLTSLLRLITASRPILKYLFNGPYFSSFLEKYFQNIIKTKLLGNLLFFCKFFTWHYTTGIVIKLTVVRFLDTIPSSILQAYPKKGKQYIYQVSQERHIKYCLLRILLSQCIRAWNSIAIILVLNSFFEFCLII